MGESIIYVPQLFGFLTQASSNLQGLFWACADWVFPRDSGVLERALHSHRSLSPTLNLDCSH